MTRARYSLTVPGPSYPWFCRAFVHANHGHLVHPDGTRHPQQVVDAEPVPGGTLVEFEAEIPDDLLDRAATTIAQPEHLTPTEAERARGWGAATAQAEADDYDRAGCPLCDRPEIHNHDPAEYGAHDPAACTLYNCRTCDGIPR